MREIKRDFVKQNPGEPERRWFEDEYFDLVVWYQQGEIISFQLSYDKRGYQRVLTWDHLQGYTHHQVDDGEEQGGRYKASAILLSDGIFDARGITGQFKARCGEISFSVATFVLDKLEGYHG